MIKAFRVRNGGVAGESRGIHSEYSDLAAGGAVSGLRMGAQEMQWPANQQMVNFNQAPMESGP